MGFLYKKKGEENYSTTANAVKENSTTHKSNLVLEDNRSEATVQKKENNTGLPDNLKTGIENLSGMAMDDVKVHYNSNKPAQLQAHAYAQGTDIHLASGQEKHLPHEAWHVVQQKQGRVQPTTQLKGKVNINDDKGLEKEADVMGSKALKQTNHSSKIEASKNTVGIQRKKIVQCYPLYDPAKTAHIKINLDGDVVMVYYEKGITPSMLATGMNVNQQYAPKPQYIVYIPEEVFIQGKVADFKVKVQDKLGVKPWFVNDPLSKAAESEEIKTVGEANQKVRVRTHEGASNRVFAARLLVWDWIKKHGLEHQVYHQEFFKSKDTFAKHMTFTGDGTPNPDLGKADEAESDEKTGAVKFHTSAMTTALGVHELVHTFFQKPGSAHSRLFEPIIEFIALRILGLQERVSPRGSFPYGNMLQGEQPRGGLSTAVDTAVKKFRETESGYSPEDLAVRWAKMLLKGDAARALKEYEGEFGEKKK